MTENYELDPDLPAQLEALAHMAEVSGLRIDDLRVMPAAGVADIVYEAKDRIEELEANLAEQIEWVRRLADDLIAAEGREARLKEKLAKVEEALRGWIDFANEQGMPVSLSDLEAAQLTGGKDE